MLDIVGHIELGPEGHHGSEGQFRLSAAGGQRSVINDQFALKMVELIKTIEEVAEAVIVQKDTSLVRKAASGSPVEVGYGLGVAVVASRVLVVKENDVKLLVQEIVCLNEKNKSSQT